MPASLCLLIATFLWGSSFIALKYTIELYSPVVVIFLRMSITLLVCAMLWRYVKRFDYQKGDGKYLLAMSLAEPCLYYLFEGHALVYTSASQAGVIVSCFPLIVAIMAFVFLKEYLSKAIVTGFIFCITGGIALTLVSPDTSAAPDPILGNILELMAMVCAAFYAVCVKRLVHRYSPLSLIALQGLSGTVFFAPFLLFVELPSTMTIESIGAILYLGAVVTLGAYGMYNYAISKVSVLTAAAFANLIPIFTLFLASMMLNEQLTWQQWLAIATVFIGVIIAQRHKPKPEDKKQSKNNNLSTETTKKTEKQPSV